MSQPDDMAERLRRVAEEVRVVAPDRFLHEAAPSKAGDAPVAGDPLAVGENEEFSSQPTRGSSLPVSPSLSAFLYTTYCLGDTTAEARARATDITTGIVMREDPAFGAALRRANRGAGVVEDGWRVVGSRDGGVLVRKDRITLLAREDDIVRRTDTGDTLSIRFPNEQPYAYPEFYLAVGNGGVPVHTPDAPLIRLYFRVEATAAPDLLSALTSTHGAQLSRFAVKVLNHPGSYSRSDAIVAYVPRADLANALSLLPGVVSSVAGRLTDPVPLCALRLGPGVGLAEDPVCGDVRFSFGQHRSMLIARGLASAFQAGALSAEQRLSFVLRELSSSDIDPAHPYCRRSSIEWLRAVVQGSSHKGTFLAA